MTHILTHNFESIFFIFARMLLDPDVICHHSQFELKSWRPASVTKEKRKLMACVLRCERWTIYAISANRHSNCYKMDDNVSVLDFCNLQAYNKSIFDLSFHADQFWCLRTLNTQLLFTNMNDCIHCAHATRILWIIIIQRFSFYSWQNAHF